MPTILDFHIKHKSENTFSLEIFERNKTQPLTTTSFDYELSYMTNFELNQLEFNAKDPWERKEQLTQFGASLYRKLFTTEVQKIWQKHKETSDFLILCLRLAPEAKGLEILPWETLYDGKEYLAAGAKTSISRLPLDITPQDGLPVLPAPLKMLAFISSPLDLADNQRLQIEREQELLLQAINEPAGDGHIRMDFEDEAKLPILESSLEGGYHIFHYTGHGIAAENGGGLLLEDAHGKSRTTSVAEILDAAQKAGSTLRLAVISGCQTAKTLNSAGFSDLARGLARRKIPGVIAMQFSISDRAGLQFARILYARIAEGGNHWNWQWQLPAVCCCRTMTP